MTWVTPAGTAGVYVSGSKQSTRLASNVQHLGEMMGFRTGVLRTLWSDRGFCPCRARLLKSTGLRIMSPDRAALVVSASVLFSHPLPTGKRAMVFSKYALPFLACATLALTGCGLRVPDIQEIYQTNEQGKDLVQAIVTNVTCEVQDAVVALYEQHPKNFMDNWGVQINLTLTIDEQTTIAPTFRWPPNGIFSLNAGAGGTADATRIDKINSFFTIRELKDRKFCLRELRPGGELLMASDLQLRNWLADAVAAGNTKEINFDHSDAFKSSGVLSHEVRFLVTTTGNVSPAWKLSRVVSVDPVGSLFSTRRDRTHDLTITFGPTDDTGKRPGTTTSNSSLASEIGASILRNVTNVAR